MVTLFVLLLLATTADDEEECFGYRAVVGLDHQCLYACSGLKNSLAVAQHWRNRAMGDRKLVHTRRTVEAVDRQNF
eukprot:CAMPEP_0179006324 /NCGR_PEP_ID=MMETSP0795-20121207/14479_1 /TAXON_ID=88552 /ORGANISM="Amoebophrya sp., Strain Ameob2" /LENGTH=75 /DNA_ID=CAMNT_0020701049 /DNA_START=65 /DNA_END=289 /DNA_ORIENTATION=-